MFDVVDNRVKTTKKGVIKILFEEFKKHVRKVIIDSIPILTQKSLCANGLKLSLCLNNEHINYSNKIDILFPTFLDT